MRAGGETGRQFTLEKISGYTMYTLLNAWSLFDRQEASLLLHFLTSLSETSYIKRWSMESDAQKKHTVTLFHKGLYINFTICTLEHV